MRKLTRIPGADLPESAVGRPARGRCVRPSPAPTPAAVRRHAWIGAARRVRVAAAGVDGSDLRVPRRQIFRLGHNHVHYLAAAERTRLDASGVRTLGFELSFPVAELMVDDPTRGVQRAAIFRRIFRNRIRTARARICCVRRCSTARAIPQIKLRASEGRRHLQAPRITARIRSATPRVTWRFRRSCQSRANAHRQRRVRHSADRLRHEALQRRAGRARSAGSTAHHSRCRRKPKKVRPG